MKKANMKTVTLAAAQMTSLDGCIMDNLARASQMAVQAKHQGAECVLFPEFMPQGYLLTTALWVSKYTCQ